MKALIYILGIIIVVAILGYLNHLNKQDNDTERSARSEQNYHYSLLDEGYQDVDIVIGMLPLDISQGPNITIGPDADFKFAFDQVVTLYDKNGKELGKAGPGHRIALGKEIRFEKLYVLSETGGKDNIYIRHNNNK